MNAGRYPFAALLGAESLQLALTLNAVNPAIGGVLIRGEKGTAKSTAARGLAALLPPIAAVTGCRFACDPVALDGGCPDGPHRSLEVESRPARLVELPVGASEDRVAGSLDLERALVEGRRTFEPGLLAAAHRGLLYVDEVNLLGDHLVDLLLDAAAMGTNHVEREGVSVRHAARFQLVGTMNPEEGELRPQLLDRFGLTVEVTAPHDPVQRAAVVRRRLAFEADPHGFAAAWARADAALAARIQTARELLGRVRLGDHALRATVAACTAFEVDGMRADIVTAKAATALAAWEGRVDVTVSDVRAAALLALPHRRRRGPFDPPGIDPAALDNALAGVDGPDDEPPGGEGRRAPGGPANGAAHNGAAGSGPAPSEADPERVGSPPATDGHPTHTGTAPALPGLQRQEATLPAGPTFNPVLLSLDSPGAGAAGRRSPARGEHGRHVADRVPQGRAADLALAATLRAAAPRQAGRVRAGGRLAVHGEDLREKVREGREGNLVLFVVDASGSMAARQRMVAVKGAVVSLLLDAYQRRDRVGLVTFRGQGAEVALPPTASVERAVRLLETLATGGRTPVAAGLERAAAVLAAEAVRDPLRRPLVVLLTDGRVTAGPDPAAAGAGLAARRVASLVVDTEEGVVRLGLAARLAQAMRGPCIQLEQLGASALAGVVRDLTLTRPRAA